MAIGDASPNAGLLDAVVIPAIASSALAALSYRYVEQPFRRRRSSPSRTTVERLDGLGRPALAEAA
jgi:peptidoglycan/LPS O-acetylase OafA/YrhL